MTPAQRNRSVSNLQFPGRLCIFSMVSGPYKALAPLFEHTARREYPDAEVMVVTQDQEPNVTRMMRFLWEDGLSAFDYVLITDIDILLHREAETIQNQHGRSMTLRGTQCYDNYIDAEAKAMLGVHFVTREWWARTRAARQTVLDGLLDANLDRRSDERALYRIVQASGLPMAPADPLPWNIHGLHLGAHRSAFTGPNARPPSSFHRLDAIRALEADAVACRLYEEAARELPWLGLMRRWWQRTFPGVVRGV